MSVSTLECDTPTGIQRPKRQTTEGGVCVLPGPLRNGRYWPSYRRCPPDNQTPACQLLPGAYVPPDWILHFACDDGYVLNINLTVAACVKGRWYPALPVCNSPKRCPALRSFGVEITCTSGDHNVPCTESVIPGTVAALKCKDGYQLPYQSEASQLTCLDSGTWDYPAFYCTPVCPPSDTLVNGKPVCKGDVVFDDTFSEPLSSKWTHEIFLGVSGWPSGFNVFTSDRKNSFTRTGSLIIKPSVNNESYVTSATVELEGCTSSGVNCVRTGSPDKILPPVATASLTTKNSFSFTYGVIEIRAKFPKGDWLLPVLSLLPKQKYYGNSETSGRIDVGLTLGNSDLWCNGEKFGLDWMANRFYLGPENKKIYTDYVVKNLQEKWYEQYHTYTVTWKPGSITFKIDNELVKEISPKETTLCETFSFFTKEDCMVYNKGSKMAPFDKDFYILLALPAADLWSATDGCVNRGKAKPWKTDDPQVLLKFWRDRENWLPTWTEEGSSLYIDYVRVTAV